MPGGPQPMERTRRLALAREIAAQFQRHYGDQVLAIGVYGSLARGMDGPYSDVEMHCVLRGGGIERCFEWTAGPFDELRAGSWKAEVDVYSEDVLLRWASQVDGDWALTHRVCTDVWALYDPTGFFPRLRDVTLSQPDPVFEQVLHDVIVGELYELIGKIRNVRAAQYEACLAYLAVEFAEYGAFLVGLANRYLYTTSTRMFEESLVLPDRPAGYDGLCHMVMVGELADPAQIVEACETFWSGIERWAEEREIQIEEDLEALLLE